MALKGQVLKIGGHLITWKGKLLVKKGDQISDFGRDFAAKALLTPVHPPVVHHHSPIVYSPPTSLYTLSKFPLTYFLLFSSNLNPSQRDCFH